MEEICWEGWNFSEVVAPQEEEEEEEEVLYRTQMPFILLLGFRCDFFELWVHTCVSLQPDTSVCSFSEQ